MPRRPWCARAQPLDPVPEEPGGSNGFAIAPSRSASGHALLWINPHTSFYFRAELQMISEQGLNVYGAVTWGQFFVYQGFNAHNGWMHTSYGGDAIDEYAEAIVERPRRPVLTDMEPICANLRVQPDRPRCQDGAASSRTFTVYHSHHGPIVRDESGKWIAVKLLEEPVRALSNRICAPRPRTTPRFARPRRCAPTRRTIRCTPTPMAPSRISMETSSRSAIRISISRSRSTAAIRRPNGRGRMPSTRPSRC